MLTEEENALLHLLLLRKENEIMTERRDLANKIADRLSGRSLTSTIPNMLSKIQMDRYNDLKKHESSLSQCLDVIFNHRRQLETAKVVKLTA